MTEERRQRTSQRHDDAVTRAEFSEFQNESRRYRCEQGKKIESIHTALFSRDSDNEHGQPGLMHTAARIEQHITAVCNLAKWGRNAFIAIAGIAAAGKAAGWF